MALLGLLGLLGLGRRTGAGGLEREALVAHALEVEVALLGAQDDASALDVLGRVEGLALGYLHAAHRGLEEAEASVLDAGAVGHQVACHIGREVEDGGYLHVVEGGVP